MILLTDLIEVLRDVDGQDLALSDSPANCDSLTLLEVLARLDDYGLYLEPEDLMACDRFDDLQWLSSDLHVDG